MAYKDRSAPLNLAARLSAFLIVSLLQVCGARAGEMTVATGLSISGDEQTTVFEATLSDDVGYSASVLPDPFRVVIDLADVSFDIPPGAGRKPKGLIKSVRYGILEEGKSRIVIDTTGPVLITQSKLIPANGKKKSRITIELMAIAQDVFEAAFARDRSKPPKAMTLPLPTLVAAKAAESDSTDIVGSISPAQSDETVSSATILKPALKPAATSKPKTVVSKPLRPDGKKVVVIDPGHGGIDPGAISPGATQEKDVVLAFAKTLKSVLEEQNRHHVVMTRTDDRFVSLNERVAIARKEGADLFIALHADTVRGQSVTGTTIYTLSETGSDAEAEALAEKENKVDAIAGIDLGEQNADVADILIDLVQRESKNQATVFSRAALKQFRPITKMTGKPLRSAGFTVLKAPDVPSVLIELGFLSNPKDEERLKSPSWQKNLALALASAINGHFSSQIAANP